MLRAFALGLAILLFSAVISVLNGILQPVVTAAGGMVKSFGQAIAKLLHKKNPPLKQAADWQMYLGDAGKGSE